MGVCQRFIGAIKNSVLDNVNLLILLRSWLHPRKNSKPKIGTIIHGVQLLKML